MTALLRALRWLVCYLMGESQAKVAEEMSKTGSAFDARNNSQAYHCRLLSICFVQVSHTSYSWYC